MTDGWDDIDEISYQIWRLSESDRTPESISKIVRSLVDKKLEKEMASASDDFINNEETIT